MRVQVLVLWRMGRLGSKRGGVVGEGILGVVGGRGGVAGGLDYGYTV